MVIKSIDLAMDDKVERDYSAPSPNDLGSDDLPRDRDPRYGYISLGSEEEPGTDAEAAGGTEPPAKAEPPVTPGELERRQTLDDLPRDCGPRWGYIELGSEDIDEQRIATGQSRAVSQRKLNANRENAQKSTGPTTSRGKTHSRQNAIKHGLFTRDLWEFVMLGESQAEYDLLLDGLHKQFEPIGKAEEL